MTTDVSTTLKYGDHEIDFAKLPPISQMALARRGFSHLMGNEAAAKVAAWVDGKAEGDLPNDAEKATFKHDTQVAFVKSLAEGTIGDRARGPRGTQLETIVRRMAEAEVKAILAASGITMPSGDKVVNLAGTELTRAQLIERRIAKHGERLGKEAEREMANRAKKAQAENLAELV